jgi:hypothetical protein
MAINHLQYRTQPCTTILHRRRKNSLGRQRCLHRENQTSDFAGAGSVGGDMIHFTTPERPLSPLSIVLSQNWDSRPSMHTRVIVGVVRGQSIHSLGCQDGIPGVVTVLWIMPCPLVQTSNLSTSTIMESNGEIILGWTTESADTVPANNYSSAEDEFKDSSNTLSRVGKVVAR